MPEEVSLVLMNVGSADMSSGVPGFARFFDTLPFEHLVPGAISSFAVEATSILSPHSFFFG